MQLPDVAAEDPRKRAVRARMRLPPAQLALRLDRRRVGSHTHPRKLHRRLDVVLRHHVVERADAAVVLDEDREERVPLLCATFGRDLRQALADNRLILVGRHRGNLHAVECRAGQQILDFGVGFDVVTHARALGRIVQPFEHLLAAAFLRPSRQRRLEAGSAGHIRVLAGRDVDAAGLGLLHEGANVRHVTPVRLRADFEVVDHHRQAGLLADLDRFADRFLHAEALAAHMRDVDAAVFGCHLCQRHELVGVGIGRRRINQCGREPERPVLHRVVQDVFFSLQFVRGRQAVLHAEHVLADHRDRRERSDVQ